MTESIDVPIGPNAQLDGGPFIAFEGGGIEDDDVRPDDGVLAGEDQEGNRAEFTISEIQRYLREEMKRNEPVSISTGDTDGMPGDECQIGTVRLPLVGRYMIEIHSLDGETWTFEALRGSGEENRYERQRVSRKLREHGGIISPRH